MNPHHLQKFLERMPQAVVVKKAALEEWEKSPCMTAHRLELLRLLEQSWGEILLAKNWDEYLESRGVYKGYLTLLELPDSLTASEGKQDAATSEQVSAVKSKIEDFTNATG